MLNTILIAYLLLSLAMSAAQLVNRNALVCRILIGLFLTTQVALTLFTAKWLGMPGNDYFAVDGLGVLLTIVVTIVCRGVLPLPQIYC